MPQAKTTTPTFIMELPLVLSDSEALLFAKTFEFARHIYNATLGTALKRLERMREDSRWRKACRMPRGKERSKAFRDLQFEYGLTLCGLRTIANDHRAASGVPLLGAHEAQNIGKAVWRALEGYIFKKGGRPRFKSKKRGINSIEGSDNRELIWKPGEQALQWRNRRQYKVLLEETDYYKACLADPADPTKPRRVKYCRVVRRKLRGKQFYYLQLVMEGTAPVRHITAPKECVAGIDPGLSRIAVYSEAGFGLFELAPCVKNWDGEIARIQRAMDRSRRRTNPQNFNADGTIRKPAEGRLQWKESRNYIRLRNQLAELKRRQAATRKRDLCQLANLVFSLGGTVRIEKNSFKAFQRVFGKSVARRAPGYLISEIKRKAACAGAEVEELDARRYRLSQYDFWTDAYVKKPLSQRWHKMGDTDVYVDRDIMSAFLACYATDKGHDPNLLREKWATAEELLGNAGLCFKDSTRSHESPEKSGRKLTRAHSPTGLVSTDKRSIAKLSAEGDSRMGAHALPEKPADHL